MRNLSLDRLHPRKIYLFLLFFNYEIWAVVGENCDTVIPKINITTFDNTFV